MFSQVSFRKNRGPASRGGEVSSLMFAAGDSPEDSSGKEDSESPRPPVYRSDELLQGAREFWIEHGEEMYRVRLTSRGRLYLTK